MPRKKRESKRHRVSKVQYFKLIDRMEKHRLVARSRIYKLGRRGNKYRQKKWKKFADVLNKIGPCQMDGESWKEHWRQCRLRSRKKKARFLKAYYKTGHNAPKMKLDKEDERICDIFGLPGLGFAIIPECGFRNSKRRPTRDQMKTICLFMIERPGLGIDLANRTKLKDLMTMLHSSLGPEFEESEWKQFGFDDVESMLKDVEQVGVQSLNEYNALLYQAYKACGDVEEIPFKHELGQHAKSDMDVDASVRLGEDEFKTGEGFRRGWGR